MRDDRRWLLLRIEAAEFVAGLLYDPAADRVMEAAPIVRWLRAKRGDEVRRLGRRYGWRVTMPRKFEGSRATARE